MCFQTRETFFCVGLLAIAAKFQIAQTVNTMTKKKHVLLPQHGATSLGTPADQSVPYSPTPFNPSSGLLLELNQVEYDGGENAPLKARQRPATNVQRETFQGETTRVGHENKRGSIYTLHYFNGVLHSLGGKAVHKRASCKKKIRAGGFW